MAITAIRERLIITPQEFCEMESYEYNRPAEERHTEAKNVHLRGETVGKQDEIGVAVFRGTTKRILVDGNSRKAAVKAGVKIPPEVYYGDHYIVDTQADLKLLYKQYSDGTFTETRLENLAHEMKYNQFDPESKMGKSTWKTAFSRCGYASPEEAIPHFKEVLIFLDSLGVKTDVTKYWSTGIKRSALDSLKISESSSDNGFVRSFWTEYANKNTDNEHVALLLECCSSRMENLKDVPMKGTQFEQALSSQAAKCVNSYVKSKRG